MRITFGGSPLLLLVPRTYFCWDSCWNFPAGTSELIPFVASSDRFCYLRYAEIPSWGLLLVFPRWGFTLIVCLLGTQFQPIGGLLFFSFLGELHTNTMYMRVATMVYITIIILRPRMSNGLQRNVEDERKRPQDQIQRHPRQQWSPI